MLPVERERDEATLSGAAEPGSGDAAGEKAASDQGIDLSRVGGTLVRDEEDYEAKATQDAIRRARDAELEALANLAIFRNNSGARNSMMTHLEWDRDWDRFLTPINPREVGKRIGADGENPKKN